MRDIHVYEGGRKGFPHLIHLVLTVVTCGMWLMWLPVWVFLWVLSVLLGRG